MVVEIISIRKGRGARNWEIEYLSDQRKEKKGPIDYQTANRKIRRFESAKSLIPLLKQRQYWIEDHFHRQYVIRFFGERNKTK